MLLAAYGILAVASSQTQEDLFTLTNSYANLPELRYDNIEPKRYIKSQLTNKQRKARSASKRARQARKNNR